MNSIPQPPTQSQAGYAAPKNPYPVPPLGDDLAVIEAESGFWTSSPQLMLICATAHRKGVGRWALLGAVLANLLSWLPPYVVLTDRDGTTSSSRTAGSLNFFVHIVLKSTGGKSRVLNAAAELVPPNVNRYGTETTEPDLCPSGTGEGLLKHFVHLQTIKDTATNESHDVMMQETDVAVVEVDEVSTYIGELARTGSKSAGIVTSLWSGQLTGSNTSGKDSRTKLARHAGRVVVDMLAQPELCAALFTDELIAGGTPQRPVWLPGNKFAPCPVQIAPQGVTITPPKDCWKYLPPMMHPQATTATPAAVNGVPLVGGSAHNPPAPNAPSTTPINTLPPELRFPRPTMSPEFLVWIHQPPSARADIAALDAANEAYDLTPAQWVALTAEERAAQKARDIQGHMQFTRLKVMVGLGLLHNRPSLQPTDEDWRLAGVVDRVSLGMHSSLWAIAQVTQLDRAASTGRDRGLVKNAENETVAEAHDRRVEELIADVWHKLAREVGPRPTSAVYRWFGHNRQKLLKEARPRMIERGLLEIDGTVWHATDPATGVRVAPPLLGPGMEAMLNQMQANQTQNGTPQ